MYQETGLHCLSRLYPANGYARLMNRFAFAPLSSASSLRVASTCLLLGIASSPGLALADEPPPLPSAAPLPVTTAPAPPSDPQPQPSAPLPVAPPQLAPPAAAAPVTVPAKPTPSAAEEEEDDDGLPAELFDKKGRLKRKLRPIEGMRLPIEYRADTRATPALWVTGVGLLAGGYGVSAAFAGFGYAFSDFCIFSSCSKDDEYLYGFIPMVGGFVAAGFSDVTPFSKGFFIFSSVTEHVGLGLLIAGIAIHQPIWRLKDAYRDQASVEINVGPGSFGLSGTF